MTREGDRSADDLPENAVCAERSDAPAQSAVIARLFAIAGGPTFVAEIEAELAAMGEEVRRQERERIADLLVSESMGDERIVRLSELVRGPDPKENADAAE